MILQNVLKNNSQPSTGKKGSLLTLTDPAGWRTGSKLNGSNEEQALKISAVYQCVNILGDSMGKLPIDIFNKKTKVSIDNHPLMHLLTIRPNEGMTPSVYKKLMQDGVLLRGNGYAYINRNATTGRPNSLIPLLGLCKPIFDDNGNLWYVVQNPKSGEYRKLDPFDIIHYKGYSEDGIEGKSVLAFARTAIEKASAAQEYEKNFYNNNARLSGVLTIDGDLEKGAKEKIREEWSKIHSGADNAFKIAVLDLGLKFQPISMSNSDAQLVESNAIVVKDISRFFNVPLYKLQEGKQSYQSNEQNSIEYVVGTLHPIVQKTDEEDSYKLLFPSEQKELKVKRNMMAELKGDFRSRGQWYKTMREIGGYSSNDIRSKEDEPDIKGGDSYNASLNYVPLEHFEEISLSRNTGKKRKGE